MSTKNTGSGCACWLSLGAGLVLGLLVGGISLIRYGLVVTIADGFASAAGGDPQMRDPAIPWLAGASLGVVLLSAAASALLRRAHRLQRPA